MHADVGGACVILSLALAGRRETGRSPFMSARKTGTPCVGQLLGHELQRLGLAGAGRARDEAVPVEHAQRDLDRRVGVGLRRRDGGAELEHATVEGVAGADLVEVGGAGRARRSGTEAAVSVTIRL